MMDWRKHMTADEAANMVAIDSGIDSARLSATQLTAQREIIRRRATARGKRKMESVK